VAHSLGEDDVDTGIRTGMYPALFGPP